MTCTRSCAGAPAPVREKTRMKDWFGMIGHRIELLSGVNFEAMISESGGADPTREGLATVVRMLEQRFEQDVFHARDVGWAMRSAPSDEEDDDAAATPVKPAWTQEEVEQFQDGLQTAMGERKRPAGGVGRRTTGPRGGLGDVCKLWPIGRW